MKTSKNPLAIGETVIIRTVTFYYTGRIVAVGSAFVVLDDAAWIPDTGRWSTALQTGQLAAVEPYPSLVSVSMGSIVDVAPWSHELPRIAK